MNKQKRELNKQLTKRVTCKKCDVVLGITGNTAYKSKNDFYCEKCIRKISKKVGK